MCVLASFVAKQILSTNNIYLLDCRIEAVFFTWRFLIFFIIIFVFAKRQAHFNKNIMNRNKEM